jgi:adenylosuccinate synthase
MTQAEMEAALRRYAACDISWRELQELGFEDYVQVLGVVDARVTLVSTGDFLRELQATGRIQSADHILDRAAAQGRNVERQRRPGLDEAARQRLRTQIEAVRDDRLKSPP